MDVIEAIKSRKSIRAFKPDPVPKEVLKKLMEVCLHAPSSQNSQPWEFAIVGGKAIDEIKQAIVGQALADVEPNPDFPWFNLSEPYKSRSREVGWQLYGALGITREDREGRRQWALHGMKFFDAPNGIILYIDRALDNRALVDAGIIVQTIMLAALEYGLGTCPQAAVVAYPDVVRRVLGIEDSKIMVCGIAIGYPDWDHPANNFQSSREPLEALAIWHGID